MKRLSLFLSGALTLFTVLFAVLFCICNAGTRLSTLTGISADDVTDIRFNYIVQSFAPGIKESCYKRFLFYVDVAYEEGGSFDYDNIYMCYHVTLKDKKNIHMFYSANKKMYVDFFDGENNYYYVSCGKVYIPWYAVRPK